VGNSATAFKWAQGLLSRFVCIFLGYSTGTSLKGFQRVLWLFVMSLPVQYRPGASTGMFKHTLVTTLMSAVCSGTSTMMHRECPHDMFVLVAWFIHLSAFDLTSVGQQTCSVSCVPGSTQPPTVGGCAAARL
jgi:hypothetical protein